MMATWGVTRLGDPALSPAPDEEAGREIETWPAGAALKFYQGGLAPLVPRPPPRPPALLALSRLASSSGHQSRTVSVDEPAGISVEERDFRSW